MLHYKQLHGVVAFDSDPNLLGLQVFSVIYQLGWDMARASDGVDCFETTLLPKYGLPWETCMFGTLDQKTEEWKQDLMQLLSNEVSYIIYYCMQ